MSRDTIKVDTVTIGEWVEKISKGDVVLPMIQRGSVWLPHKILDLWDTLLRGMPMGAQIIKESQPETEVINLITRKLIPAPPNAVDLVDGQQRTLSILANWPGIGDEFDRAVAVWIDLADDPQSEYKFRLYIATRAQPFGYQRASMGGQTLGKLPAAERRWANIVYVPDLEKIDVHAIWRSPGYMPWKSKFALRLSDMQVNRLDLDSFVNSQIEDKLKEFEKLATENMRSDISESDQQKINEIFKKRCEFLKDLAKPGETKDKLSARLDDLRESLVRLPGIQFPIICIPDSHVEDSKNSEGDPALAVLFKRIGTSGQDLSNADYVFSLIKHKEPKTHSLVEILLKYERVAAIFQASDLVMSAVRLTLLSIRKNGNHDDQRSLRDHAQIDKATFANLVRRNSDFLNAFKIAIQTTDGTFAKVLSKVFDAISYSEAFDLGLPKHALSCLVNQAIFDVVLAWAWSLDEPIRKNCKLPLVRFLLWAHVCVYDHNKASELCIRVLEEQLEMQDFPDALLITELINGKCAYPLPSPDDLNSEGLKGLVNSDDLDSSDGIEGLRGRKRFDYQSYRNGGNDIPEVERYKIEVYRRWWNLRGTHSHPMLLWLQRSYVFRRFEKEPALAGMTDETPYDFDHILPQSHWGGWAPNGENRLIDFHAKKSEDNTGHTVLGNALGNLRIWSSPDNRSDGDNPPNLKLKLGQKEAEQICFNSAIKIDQTVDWETASCVNNEEFRYWDLNRSLAFQRAVEKRTFSLYCEFYEKLNMQQLESVFIAHD